MSESVEELRRSISWYRGLVEVSLLINSITDFNELLSEILDVGRRVMRTAASSLYLIEESTGALELVITRGPGWESFSGPVRIPSETGIASWVRSEKQSASIKDAYLDERFSGEEHKQDGFITTSVMAIPLFQGDAEIGVLEVLNPIDKPHFDSFDLEAFEAYGNLVATAIGKLRSFAREQAQNQLAKDLEFATEIQHSFLPGVLPSTDHLAFSAHYRPARDIAGDFYDVFERNPGEFYFVIGDVSGTGIPAALMMAQTLSMLRLIIHPNMAPADALAKWNARMCGRTIRGMFITTLLGRIRPEFGLIEFAVAGHSAPLVRHANLVVEEPPFDAAPPLGISKDLIFPNNQIILLPGDQAIFYTDGLVESFNSAREPFSLERVRKVLTQPLKDSEAIVKALIEAEEQHRGETAPHDDLTILTVGLK
jgi:sigma-B regulation protein RsbU (phosphoserine phosphatase)